MIRTGRFLAAAAVLAGVGAASTGVVGASGAPRGAASWHLVAEVFANSGDRPSSFEAVVAMTPTSAWAFETTGSKTAPLVAWKVTGSSWSKVAFPEDYGSDVVNAVRATSTSVYVATSGGALLTWSGTSWSLVSKFAAITDIAATGAGDVWVNGRRTTSRATRGLWHLSHGVWTHASVQSFGSLDAVSDTAIFSVTDSAVKEFDGSRWLTTSLVPLLPPKQPLCPDPGLTSIEALTPTDLWVTAAGNCQDFSGPFRLLHYVRSAWSIAADRQVAHGYAFAAGDGGLWIPTRAFACTGCTQMLHLAHGRLTQVALPLPASKGGVTLDAGSTAPGSTASIAVGWTLSGSNFQEIRGVILQYGP